MRRSENTWRSVQKRQKELIWNGMYVFFTIVLQYSKETRNIESVFESFCVFLCLWWFQQVSSLLRGSAPGLDSAPRWLQLSCEALCKRGRPPGVALYLSHGALAMLGWKGSLPGPQWEELLLLVPETLLDLDVRYAVWKCFNFNVGKVYKPWF